MLEKGKNKVLPCGRNSLGALDSALSSMPLCLLEFAFRFPRQPQALFKTALRIVKRTVSQNHCFAVFLIQPGVPNDKPNDNETINKKSHGSL